MIENGYVDLISFLKHKILLLVCYYFLVKLLVVSHRRISLVVLLKFLIEKLEYAGHTGVGGHLVLGVTCRYVTGRKN